MTGYDIVRPREKQMFFLGGGILWQKQYDNTDIYDT